MKGQQCASVLYIDSRSRTVRVSGVPAQLVHSLLKHSLGIGLEARVVVSVREKTTNGGQVASLGGRERRE